MPRRCLAVGYHSAIVPPPPPVSIKLLIPSTDAGIWYYNGSAWQFIGGLPSGGWSNVAASPDGTCWAVLKRSAPQLYVTNNTGQTWQAITLDSAGPLDYATPRVTWTTDNRWIVLATRVGISVKVYRGTVDGQFTTHNTGLAPNSVFNGIGFEDGGGYWHDDYNHYYVSPSNVVLNLGAVRLDGGGAQIDSARTPHFDSFAPGYGVLSWGFGQGAPAAYSPDGSTTRMSGLTTPKFPDRGWMTTLGAQEAVIAHSDGVYRFTNLPSSTAVLDYAIAMSAFGFIRNDRQTRSILALRKNDSTNTAAKRRDTVIRAADGTWSTLDGPAAAAPETLQNLCEVLVTGGIAPTPTNPNSITSSGSASGVVGQAFSYQITANNSPASYNAVGLPAGLTVNTTTGAISGTPTTAATTSATISATGTGGTATAVLQIIISATASPPPAYPSPTGAYTANTSLASINKSQFEAGDLSTRTTIQRLAQGTPLAATGGLRTDEEAAALVIPVTYNVKESLNEPGNHTVARSGTDYTIVDHSGIGATGNSYFRRVTGNFVGTTAEIVQWAAAKWGLAFDDLAAQLCQETNWNQRFVGDNGHSFSIAQIKDFNHTITYPASKISTAFGADYLGAWIRMVWDGHCTYMNGQSYNGLSYPPSGSDASYWQAAGTWYTGQWNKVGTASYANLIKGHKSTRKWETY